MFKLLLSRLSHWWAAARSCSYDHFYKETQLNAIRCYERALEDGDDEWAERLRSRYGIAQPMVEE